MLNVAVPSRFVVTVACVAAALVVGSPPAGRGADPDGGLPLLSSTGTSSTFPTPWASTGHSAQESLGGSRPDAAPATYTSDEIDDTLVFLNGRFIAPPFVVSSAGDQVLVNGIEFPTDEVVLRSLRQAGLLAPERFGSRRGRNLEISGHRWGRFREPRMQFDTDAEEAEEEEAEDEFDEDDEDTGFDGEDGEEPDDVAQDRDDGADDREDSDGTAVPPEASVRNESKSPGQPQAFSLSPARLARAIATVLDCGHSVCVVFSRQPFTCLSLTNGGLELLKALQSRGRDLQAAAYALNRVSPDIDRDVWDTWIATFRTSSEFDAVTQQAIDLINGVEAKNSRSRAAVERLRSMTYPLSVIGLMLTVFSFGHVVSHKPPTRYTPVSDEHALETQVMVHRSLILVVALSLLDLVWTILASQANQMVELNPFGRALIHDPILLSGFKFAMTGFAVTLLFVLRSHRVAQTASWWACMILTLLTMRWLALTSMLT